MEILCHAKKTCSIGIHVLLEEIGAPYEQIGAAMTVDATQTKLSLSCFSPLRRHFLRIRPRLN